MKNLKISNIVGYKSKPINNCQPPIKVYDYIVFSKEVAGLVFQQKFSCIYCSNEDMTNIVKCENIGEAEFFFETL